MLFGYRLRLFTLAEEMGMCPLPVGRWGSTTRPTIGWKRRSTVGDWRRCGSVSAAAADAERDRPAPRAARGRLQRSAIPAWERGGSASELAREKWGGLRISEHGVWRVLCRYGLNTRSKRLALIARHRDPYERKPERPPPELTSTPLSPARRSSSTASTSGAWPAPRGPSGNTPRIDVASGFAWAELHELRAQPSAPGGPPSSSTALRASSRRPAGAWAR